MKESNILNIKTGFSLDTHSKISLFLYKKGKQCKVYGSPPERQNTAEVQLCVTP